MAMAYDYGDREVHGNGVCILAWIYNEIEKDEYFQPPQTIEIIETENSLAIDSLIDILKKIRDKQLTNIH